MEKSQQKIETVADYTDRSAKTIQFCKENFEKAKSNPYLKNRARSLIREKLLQGIEVEEAGTGKKWLKKFDYPVEYIAQVLNRSNRTFNKWVIICAINYVEQYAEGEDPTLLSLSTSTQPAERTKSAPKKSNQKGAIAKRIGLRQK